MNVDYSSFHPAPCDVEIVQAGGHLYAHCITCRVVADLEGASAKVGPGDAFKVGNTEAGQTTRDRLGKLSPGVSAKGNEVMIL